MSNVYPHRIEDVGSRAPEYIVTRGLGHTGVGVDPGSEEYFEQQPVME